MPALGESVLHPGLEEIRMTGQVFHQGDGSREGHGRQQGEEEVLLGLLLQPSPIFLLYSIRGKHWFGNVRPQAERILYTDTLYVKILLTAYALYGAKAEQF